MKFIGAELENRIQVTVENNWNLRFATNLADTIENAANGRSGRESALRCKLIYNSVSQRIGEGQTELKQIGARLFERQSQLGRLFQIRIAGANIRDKSLRFSERSRAKHWSIRLCIE